VLEHVRQPRLSAGIVGVASIDACIEGEDGSLGAFADNQRKAVGQHLNGDSFFKTCQVLGMGDRRGKEQQYQESSDRFTVCRHQEEQPQFGPLESAQEACLEAIRHPPECQTTWRLDGQNAFNKLDSTQEFCE